MTGLKNSSYAKPTLRFAFALLLASPCWAGDTNAGSVASYFSEKYCESLEFLECVGMDVQVCSALFMEASGSCDYAQVSDAIENDDADRAFESSTVFAECLTRNLSRNSRTIAPEWNRCMLERSSAIKEERIQDREQKVFK